MQALILHGWQGSGPGHWQSWLAGRLRAAGLRVRYPELPDADEPDPAAWDAALAAELAALGGGGERVVVCHSLGCALWLRAAARAPGRLAERVLLVAPPAPDSDIPQVRAFFPTGATSAALARAAQATRLVCSDDDPYCPDGAAGVYGGPLGLPVDLLPGGGHLNPDAGYGPWPAVEAWVLGDAARITAR